MPGDVCGCYEPRRLPGPEPGRQHVVVGGTTHLGGAVHQGSGEGAPRAEDPVDPGAGWQETVSTDVAPTRGGHQRGLAGDRAERRRDLVEVAGEKDRQSVRGQL